MNSKRSIELDLLRVLAIAMMMAYHFAYDLQFFYSYNLGVTEGPWHILERVCASLFLLLVGISFVLSWKRNPDWKRSASRGLKVLAYGFVVSAATYAFDPASFVQFGILHVIGVGTMLLPLFAPLRGWNVLLGLGIVLLGFGIEQGTGTSPWFIPLGFTPKEFFSVDHFPLLPWFGVILIGAGGAFLRSQSLFLIPESAKTRFPRFFAANEWISKRSLAIYMIHQPLILGVLHLTLGR